MAVRALEAEKASHTDTLVKLRLTEERLAASEAERERLREVAEIRKRDSVEAEQALWRIYRLVTGKDTVPGDYNQCIYEITLAMNGDHELAGGIYDEPTDSDAAITLVMNERPGE
jgi:hypothetical protein